MKNVMTTSLKASCGVLTAVLLLAGCKGESATAGIVQTKYPGQVTAGGATSGQTMERNGSNKVDATYAGGTPGIAGGSGGSTGGAMTAGSVQESGQGPSSGTTTPAAAGQAGTALQPGENVEGGNKAGGAASESGNSEDKK